MIFETPRIEFVSIDVKIIAASTCDETNTWCKGENENSKAGGGQRCVASQIDAHPCDSWTTDIPWKGKQDDSSKSTKSSAPKNVVGFDMTFDK